MNIASFLRCPHLGNPAWSARRTAWTALVLVPALAWAQSATAPAASSAAGGGTASNDARANYASDNDRYDGDRFHLRTRVTGFKETGDLTLHCAPAETEMQVVREVGNELRVRFLKVPRAAAPRASTSAASAPDAAASAAAPLAARPAPDMQGRCPAGSHIVSTGIIYLIDKASIRDDSAFRRTGFSFGALLVPFKFRTGDKEIISSPTLAPYVGWRLGVGSSLGITITPVFSAGLALLPVSNSSTGTIDTRPAFSMATGAVMGSSKNEAFQAGILIGRDYLGRTDRANDPGSRHPWISFYVGFTFSQN